MAENKTKATKVASEQQRKDSTELIAMMCDITGEPPKMWESSMCLTGFSPRKPSLVLYIGEALNDIDRSVLRALITKAARA